MGDMAAIIQPKSDQLNADSLAAGPITIKVAKVSLLAGQEQPCVVHYEGDNGKPYKPCKSMARVMVQAWGPDSAQYVGKSMTLYRDPDVKWAGMAVGGIRISAMSHIDRDMVLSLTASKGSYKPFKVRPLKAETVPLKVVEPEQAATDAFDFEAFEADVAAQIDAGTEGLAEWWETMKETRIKAGSMDRARAIALAGRVKAALEGEI